jgi:hypothetical protein
MRFTEGKKHTSYSDYDFDGAFIPDPIVVRSFAELPGAVTASRARKRIAESLDMSYRSPLADLWGKKIYKLFLDEGVFVKGLKEKRAGAEAWNP